MAPGRGAAGGGRGRGGRGRPTRGPGSGVATPTTVKLKRQRAGVLADVDVEVFTPNTMRPVYVDRSVREIPGERWARRPSQLAKLAGKRTAAEVLFADSYDGATDDWATTEPMPYETNIDDCNWEPGPIHRPNPVFKGPTPGPTDPSLAADTCEEKYVNSQISDAFLDLCVRYTTGHARAWRRERPGTWKKDSIEIAVKDERRINRDAIRL